MQLKDFTKLYFAILLLQLVTIFKQDFGLLHVVSKVLLLATLFLFYTQARSVKNQPYRYWLMAALAASWLGDIFLLNQTSKLLALAGLAAFALAHLFYTATHLKAGNILAHPLKAVLLFVPSLVLGYYAILFLHPPDRLSVYLYVYGAILTLHLVLAAVNLSHGSLDYLPLAGAFLFLLSHYLWACNRFIQSHVYFSLAVMFLYGLGQFLIVKGFLDQSANTKIN
jgi:uncharacterized membrane protein YhhN